MSIKRGFRIASLNRMIATSGLLVDQIQKAVDSKAAKQPAEASKPVFSKGTLRISAGVPGVAVIVPANPIIGGETYTDESGNVKYKKGTYNLVGWIKPGKIMENGLHKPTLVNAIMVIATPVGTTADGKPLASTLSSGYSKQFGNKQWWETAKANIDRAMKAHYGNVSLGKQALASFSGGYAAVSSMLDSGADPDAVLVLDGTHGKGSLETFRQYAGKAAKDPGKQFIFVHSQITPSRKNKETGKWETYMPTSYAGNEIAKSIGADYVPGTKNYSGIIPAGTVDKGGAHIVSMYSPDRKNDDLHNLKRQHIEISDRAVDFLDELALRGGWNNPTS